MEDMKYSKALLTVLSLGFSHFTYAALPTNSILNIIATNSNKCLDVRAPKTSPDAAIVQMTCGTDPSQTWKLIPLPNNQFQIVSASTGLCFDLSGASKLNGGVLKQSDCVANRPNQTWTLQQVNPNYFEITSLNSQKCLDVPNASSADNVQIQQWTCGAGAPNQTWFLQATNKPSDPIVIDNKSNVTIENVKITNPSGPCILVKGNSKNIVINNSELGPCNTNTKNPQPDLSNVGAGVFVTGTSSNVTINNVTIHDTDDSGVNVFYGSGYAVTNSKITNAKGQAIKFQAASNITISNNMISNSLSGIYVSSGSNINVKGNNITHIHGKPRANFVQFNTVTGAGNSIQCNTGIQDPYGAPKSLDSIEDAISLYRSHGTAASPILVAGNKVKNGGPSSTGGGIMLGDGGGAYITARNNVVVTPGGYGMAVSGGSNMVMQNNFIFSAYTPIVNNAIPIWNYDSSTGACANITVSGNHVNWTNTWGPETKIWVNNTCTNTQFTNNTFQDATVTPAIFDTYIAPDCAK
jgi:parallel beta-helix repeat protein